MSGTIFLLSLLSKLHLAQERKMAVVVYLQQFSITLTTLNVDMCS